MWLMDEVAHLRLQIRSARFEDARTEISGRR